MPETERVHPDDIRIKVVNGVDTWTSFYDSDGEFLVSLPGQQADKGEFVAKVFSAGYRQGLGHGEYATQAAVRKAIGIE